MLGFSLLPFLSFLFYVYLQKEKAAADGVQRHLRWGGRKKQVVNLSLR